MAIGELVLIPFKAGQWFKPLMASDLKNRSFSASLREPQGLGWC